jgi:hypothetical protein
MRRAITVVVPLVVVFALAMWRAKGPEPKPLDTPAGEFAAARAMQSLRGLLGNGAAHPVGTAANAEVRSRLIAQFQSLGYETSVQSRFACNAAAVCALVHNVIARQPGAARRDAVYLMAHYDSVGAGGGASDDGMGTAAILEVARAMRGQTFRNPVVFLITDGEEAGLLGAEGFIADETLAREVGVVINVEMRGTYGPSNMFETSTGNRWLIRHLSRALERPQATSFFYAIYNLLPNDTDVTIFKRAGKAAVNFAAIRGVHWYHTPFDDLAHADPRTLQHHGDNLLATARALADADLAARSGGDTTYFDILGFLLLWWPQQGTLWLGIVSVLVLVFAARKQVPREMTFGVLAAFTTLLASAVIGFVIAWIARLRSADVNFVARPGFTIAAMWLAGLAAALFACALFRKRAKPLPMLYGIAIVWHMIGIALAVQLPGAAFLFLVPAVAVTICALARADEVSTSGIAATVGAILIFPMALMLYEALGASLMVALTILVGALSMFVAPLFARVASFAVVLGLAIFAAVAGMMQPAYDAEHPRRISLSYIDDGGAPRWFAPRPVTNAFRPADPSLTPWNPGGFTAPASSESLPRVSLTATRSGERMTFRVRTLRGATRLNLLLQGNARVLRVNGVTPPPRPARFRERMPSGWHMAVANGVEEMVVECEVKGPVQAVASDLTFGLPPSGAALKKTRDEMPAIPIHDGDMTITRVRAKF